MADFSPLHTLGQSAFPPLSIVSVNQYSIREFCKISPFRSHTHEWDYLITQCLSLEAWLTSFHIWPLSLLTLPQMLEFYAFQWLNSMWTCTPFSLSSCWYLYWHKVESISWLLQIVKTQVVFYSAQWLYFFWIYIPRVGLPAHITVLFRLLKNLHNGCNNLHCH